MAICKTCGAQMDDNATACPICGAAAEGQDQTYTPAVQNAQAQQNGDDAADVASSKALAWLAYIPWTPVFLVPFFVKKWSKYARFHVRQGATLWAISAVYSVLQGIISGVLTGIVAAIRYNTNAPGLAVLVVLTNLLLSAVQIGICVFAVIGIVKAATGQKYELPLVSKIPFVAKLIDFFYGKMGVDVSGD